MKRLVSTLNMPYEEWLKCRKQGLGGSDAGAVCGLNPYVTAIDVYYDKTTQKAVVQDNEAMRQGRDLEAYVAERFTEATGLKLRRSNAIYQHEKYPYLLANVDRLIAGQNAGLECKTASAYSADKWKDGEVPAHYYIQCLHYMAVTGADAWYLAVVILGREFKYVKIERDESVIKNLLAVETDFWNSNVVSGVMPDPDGSKICDEVIRCYYPSAVRGKEIPLIGFDEKLERRQEIDILIKRLETESREIEQEIKLYMAESETAVSERYKITWSSYETVRIDSRKLKVEKPEIYEAFSAKSKSRRFMVTAA